MAGLAFDPLWTAGCPPVASERLQELLALSGMADREQTPAPAALVLCGGDEQRGGVDGVHRVVEVQVGT